MIFDENYYERGLETGKSCFQNYRWIPELTIPMAMSIIDYLGIEQGEAILDYGCAKGFLVKAFRLLHRKAYGADISDYALSQVDDDIKHYIVPMQTLMDAWENEIHKHNKLLHFKYGICKDVFEHIKVEDLEILLRIMNVEILFVIVPLGKNGKYTAKANNLDVTHIICEDVPWWLSFIESCGWAIKHHTTKFLGIKDTYANIPDSHLFLTCRR